MKKKPVVTVLFAALTLTMFSSLAIADVSKGRFRLHFDSTLLHVKTGETEQNDVESDFGGLSLGLGKSHSSIGLGVSLGGKLVLGARLSVGLQADDFDFFDGEDVTWAFLPYLEWVYLTGKFRPFLVANVGLEGLSTNNRYFFGLLLGGGGGAHIFLLNRTSLDLTMLLGHRFGTGENTAGVDFTHWRFSFATLIGLSTWF